MTRRLDWLYQSFAHRGLHNFDHGIVENTSTAFQAAIDAGYGIECDVRFSGDEDAIVFHDATLERLTRGKGEVSRLSVPRLKNVRFRKTEDRIQTLGELLEQVSGRVPLIIEIKTDWKMHGPLERRLADILCDYKGQFGVMSFDPNSIKALAEIAPRIARGLVAERFTNLHGDVELSARQRFMMRHLLSSFIARPQFINYDVQALPALAPWVWRNVLRRPLLTWTVRSPGQAQSARRWADAIVFEGFRPDGEDELNG